MGFMNWLMKNVGFEDEEVYDNSVEKQKKYEEKLKAQEEKRRQKEEQRAYKARERADRAAEKYALKQEKDMPQRPESSTVNYSEDRSQYNFNANNNNSYSSSMNNYGIMNGSSSFGGTTKNVEFLYPTKFDDVQVVINYLKEGESVMLNLNNMNEIDAQKLMDCAFGAIYALNGNIRHVDSNIFLLTPDGYAIKTPDDK